MLLLVLIVLIVHRLVIVYLVIVGLYCILGNVWGIRLVGTLMCLGLLLLVKGSVRLVLLVLLTVLVVKH